MTIRLFIDTIQKENWKENKFLAANKVDKGKSIERLRRKAMGLKHVKCYDRQAADFFVLKKEWC